MKGGSLRRGIFIFLLITLIAAFLVIVFTIEKQTIHMLFRIKASHLLLALFWVFLSWVFDYLRLRELTRAAGGDISFFQGLALVWINYFGCAVTPLQSGGGPFQIYMLYRSGLPIGKGFAVTLMRTLITLVILSFAGPMIAFTHPEILENSFLRGMMLYVVIFLIFVWIIIFISLKKPQVIKRWSSSIVLFLGKLGLFRKKGSIEVLRRVYREIDLYNENFRVFFGEGKGRLFIAVIYSFFQLFVSFLALPFLMWGVGMEFDLAKVLMIQAVFLFLLYFVPTPGGSGVAEGGGAVLFRYVMPVHMTGVMAILWRFFTDYIAVILGGIVAIKVLGLKTIEEVVKTND
ncbi:MAG: flippase-like domain-containing protein [Synergistetes bacterium]|nr:flippase-like domain-containing protein [Synergistota bacterium]